jgi:hypothetical protein
MRNDMTERDAEMNDWITMIIGEYREMPGLQLTKAQVRRLWGLQPPVCDALLDTLEKNQFLQLTARGCYVLGDSYEAAERNLRSRETPQDA